MTDCVLDIHHWSSSHRLKLNACKSEVVWLGTSQQLTRLSHDDKVLELPDGALQPSTTTVKNLGVHLDDTLTMDDNAKQCVERASFTCAEYINFAGSLMTTPCILWFQR